MTKYDKYDRVAALPPLYSIKLLIMLHFFETLALLPKKNQSIAKSMESSRRALSFKMTIPVSYLQKKIDNFED